MAQTLRLKRSSVAGRRPTTASLQTGEFAINTADGLVYIRKDDDSIIPLIGVNTAAVTGSVELTGSVTATTFIGDFIGNFSGSVNATLTKSASNGAGIATFVFDGSDNVTISLNTGSAHFISGVNNLIAVGTALSASFATTASFAQNANTAQIATTASYALIAQQLLGLDTGSFVNSGSISNATITLNQAGGTSFNLTVNNVANATSASFAATATSASYATVAQNVLNLDTGSLLQTGSVSNATITLTKANGSSFALTVDNVQNAISASFATSALTATTASYTLVAQTVLNLETGSFVTTGSVSNDTLTFTQADQTTFDLTVNNVQNATSASFATSALLATSASFTATASYVEGYVRDGGGAANQITVWSDGETATGYTTFVRSANGSIGIGTSSPVRSIDVVSNTGTSVGLKLNSTATGGRSYSFFSTNDTSGIGGGKFGVYDDTAQASRITLDGTGNVGIGSTAPAYKLDVIGDTRVTGDLVVTGKVTAEEFHTEFVSSSIIYSSGSTKFGDTLDDIHQFTGSVQITGSLTAPDITINQWGSVSASLASLNSSAQALTLQDVTDNGNTTTNQIIINNELIVSQSVFSRGEEVLDFAVAMAIALG